MTENHPFLGDFKPMDRDDFIQHYGVKGMKWGVRRKSGGVKKARKAKPPSTAERKAEVKKMSDSDLRQKINRIQMESQYLKLTEPPPTGLKKVEQILTSSAERQATQAINNFAAKQIKEALKG